MSAVTHTPQAYDIEREMLAAAVSAVRPDLSVQDQDVLVDGLSHAVAHWQPPTAKKPPAAAARATAASYFG